MGPMAAARVSAPDFAGGRIIRETEKIELIVHGFPLR
jgi:hypothetical protein